VRVGGEGRGRSRETREGEGRRKKEGTSGGQRSLLDPSPPFLSDLAAPLSLSLSLSLSLTPHVPSSLPLATIVAGVRGRVYFFNLPEDRQLDFLGSFGYRISVRLPGSCAGWGRGAAGREERDPAIRRPAPQIRSRGTTYTCARDSCI